MDIIGAIETIGAIVSIVFKVAKDDMTGAACHYA